jgi:hypothetical protein
LHHQLNLWFHTDMEINDLTQAIAKVGGPSEAARICAVSAAAVGKWLKRGHLPRTEYTGETNYSELLSKASRGAFTAKQLKDLASPHKHNGH